MAIIITLILNLLVVYPAIPVSTSNDVCLSSVEQELFDMINEYRESKKLTPIPYSVSLTMVAQAHVQDLHNNYEFSANAKCNPHSWSKKGNWSSCCYSNDHKQAQCMWDKPKEIAGYDSHGYEIAYYQSDGALPFVALEGWKKSKGHNPVIINKGIWEQLIWGGMGVGIYEEYAVVWFGVLKEGSEIVNCED